MDNRVRLLDAAVALLRNAPERTFHIVVLNKALFYLDLASLRDLGDTVTHNTYIALPMGPVVARYDKRLVTALEKEGLAEQRPDGLAKPVRLISDRRPEHLSVPQLELAARVAHWAKDLSSTYVSDYSHRNPGWLLARTRGGGNVPKPINMSIAMQQIMDEDPWLDEPIPDHILDRARLADDPWV